MIFLKTEFPTCRKPTNIVYANYREDGMADILKFRLAIRSSFKGIETFGHQITCFEPAHLVNTQIILGSSEGKLKEIPGLTFACFPLFGL